MLSIEKCKELLEKNGGSYTDEQVVIIRDFLHSFARFGMEEWEKLNKKGLLQKKLDELTSEK